MKKTALLLIGLTVAILANGQTIQIQGGSSISKLDWQYKGVEIRPIFDQRMIGSSFFAGLVYFDKQYYNLSTNIGMLRKGGKDEIPLVNMQGDIISKETKKATLDYLSLNTMLDLKYPIKETFTPFISFGPRIDYLISSNNLFDDLKDLDELKSISAGLLFGGGVRYDFSKLQFGLRADYYLDCTKVANWEIENTGVGGEISARTYTINLTIGYRLQ